MNTKVSKCCCFHLRIGTLIIGFLDLMLATIFLITTFIAGYSDESLLTSVLWTGLLILGIVAAGSLLLGVQKVCDLCG